MKYCAKCGTELMDEAVVCPKCGCPTELYDQHSSNSNNALQTATKVLMIIGTVLNGLAIFPLAWCIPMTVSYCKKIKNNKPISTGFKVCSLLFVSLIAGVLMLCDNKE